MNESALLSGLAQWGYPMLQVLPENEPEDVLLNLLRQKDMRLLEGFPVVFYHMLQEKPETRWERESWDPRAEMKSPVLFVTMVLGSLFLLEGQKENVQFLKRTRKILDQFPEFEDLEKKFREAFQKNLPWKVRSGETAYELSPERFKKTFTRYKEKTYAPEAEQQKFQLEREWLLSELFTPKQKELMRKKMEGKKLTKTEKEYFSRVVKKRLRALADEQLHQLAQKLVA